MSHKEDKYEFPGCYLVMLGLMVVMGIAIEYNDYIRQFIREFVCNICQ